MATLAVLGQKQIVGLGLRQYVITQVNHDGGSNTVYVDPTASVVRAVPLAGQTAPTVTIGSVDTTTTNDSYAQVAISVSGGGSGLVDIITFHGAVGVAGSKAV